MPRAVPTPLSRPVDSSHRALCFQKKAGFADLPEDVLLQIMHWLRIDGTEGDPRSLLWPLVMVNRRVSELSLRSAMVTIHLNSAVKVACFAATIGRAPSLGLCCRELVVDTVKNRMGDSLDIFVTGLRNLLPVDCPNLKTLSLCGSVDLEERMWLALESANGLRHLRLGLPNVFWRELAHSAGLRLPRFLLSLELRMFKKQDVDIHIHKLVTKLPATLQSLTLADFSFAFDDTRFAGLATSCPPLRVFTCSGCTGTDTTSLRMIVSMHAVTLECLRVVRCDDEAQGGWLDSVVADLRALKVLSLTSSPNGSQPSYSALSPRCMHLLPKSLVALQVVKARSENWVFFDAIDTLTSLKYATLTDRHMSQDSVSAMTSMLDRRGISAFREWHNDPSLADLHVLQPDLI